ncbi:MAG: EF-hand domain-containing protein [Pseudomonadota bacterium]
MKRREKKSESLDIRLPYQQKQDFMAATKQRGETASQALRHFISTYIEEARLEDQPNKVQEITMTLARHRLKSIATAAGAAIGVFSVTALPSAADSTAFDALDKNNDGLITEGEIAPGHDADIIAKLDTDGSGGVSREELEAAGNRIEIIHTGDEMGDDGETIIKKTVKVLEFNDEAGGEIHGEVKIESNRKVIVKRIDAGEELSEADLDILIEEALGEAGVDEDVDVRIKKIIRKEAETEE